MSSRSYTRLLQDGKTAIILSSVSDDHPKARPGHLLADTIRMTEELESVGLRVPLILAKDIESGFVLLEDLGDQSLGNTDMAETYPIAVDVLLKLRDSFVSNTHNLKNYYDSHIHAALRFAAEYYIPASGQAAPSEELVVSYLAVWQDIEESLDLCPMGFVHADYHAGNILWLDHEEGIRRCGLLDYQGALWGPLPYDLVNLLDDARRDISGDLKQKLLERYLEGCQDPELFMRWYKVLKIQFHSRVLGQFIKIAQEGNGAYLEHIPRLQSSIDAALEEPLLAPLKEWSAQNAIDWLRPVDN